MQTFTFFKNKGLRWHILLPIIALFIGFVNPHSVWGQRFSSDNLTISASPSGGTSTSFRYFGKNGTTANSFQGKDLGKGASFDQNQGSLKINNISASFTGTSDSVNGTPRVSVISSSLFYRVYLNVATNKPGYTEQQLSQTSSTNYNAPVTYGASNLTIDLLNQPAVLGGGTYNVDIYFQATYDDGSSQTTVFTDPGNGATNPYTATFQVIAPAVTPGGGTTTWISTSSTDWSVAANWSNGVPTYNSDAIIPAKTAGGTATTTPLLNNPAYQYRVRTITLQGTSNSTRALLRIGQSTTTTSGQSNPIGATLRVYGDLNTFSGGVLAAVSGSGVAGVADTTKNSTIVLAGQGYQIVRGVLNIVDFRVEGSGLKAVTSSINATNTFVFNPLPNGPGSIMQTSNDDGTKDPNTGLTTSDPTINTTLGAVVNLKDSGYMFGETNTSFVRGITLADRALLNGVKQTFGNIGLDITTNRDIPAPNVQITRTVGDPFYGPLGSSSTAPNGAPQPVKRQYGVSGDVNNNTTSTIGFHYLNNTDELNGNPEQNLYIFKTANNGPPFTPVGRTGPVDLVNRIVTVQNYSQSLNTLTLGDQNNPLPVELAAFNAARNGSNALLTWTTASEKNNKGFNVQVSADGLNFRTLAFVASQSPNSGTSLNYKYTDTENGKSGTRYYRLEQVDLDGKTSYSPVRALNFDALAANAVALVAYPNPFTDTIGLSLNGTSVADGVAYVKMVDMTGRTVLDQKLSLVGASLSLGDLTALRSGLYLAKVTLPDGTTQTVRVQKQ